MTRPTSQHFLFSGLMELLPNFLLMGLRGVSLVIKFVLLILMGRYFTLHEIGIYGLLVAITLVYSQVAGWGVGLNLTRRMVDAPKEERQKLLGHQWGVFSYTYLFTALLFTGISFTPLYQVDEIRSILSLTTFIIIISEHASQELSRLLMSTNHQIKANILLFIRSAGWAVPLSIALLFTPSVRNLETVLSLWALGGGLSVLLGFWWCRIYVLKWPAFTKDIGYIPFSWLAKHAGVSMMIYLAFSINVIMSYLNRFAAGYFLTMSETGLYTLYWSIINAIYVLASTGFIQVAYPSMIESRSDKEAYHTKTLRLYKQSIVFGLLSGAFVAAIAPFLFSLMHKEEAIQHLPTFYVMLAGSLIKLFSTVSFYALYARHDDKPLMNGMILAFLLSIPVSFGLVAEMGLLGAAISDGLSVLMISCILVNLYLKRMGMSLRCAIKPLFSSSSPKAP